MPEVTINIWQFIHQHEQRNAQLQCYLVSLVRFGHSALWNNLHSIHLIAGKISHLITSSKPSLQ